MAGEPTVGRGRESRGLGRQSAEPVHLPSAQLDSHRIGFFLCAWFEKAQKCAAEICDCRGKTKICRTRRLIRGSATEIGAGESATQRAARRTHRRRLDPRPVRASRADRDSTRARIPAFACPAIRPRIRVERASRGSVGSHDAPEANLRRRRRRARWTRCDGPPSRWRGAAAANPRSVAVPRWTSRWCVIARSVGSALAPHVASQSRFSTSPLTRHPEPPAPRGADVRIGRVLLRRHRLRRL